MNLFKAIDCKISTDFKHPVQDCKRVADPSVKTQENSLNGMMDMIQEETE